MNALGSLALILVLSSKKRNQSVNWLRALIMSVGLNTIAQFFLTFTTDPLRYVVLQKIGYLALLMIVPSYINFAYAYVGREKTIKNLLFVLFLSSSFFLILFVWWNTNLIAIFDYERALWSYWGPVTPPGRLQILVVLYFTYYFIHGTRLLIKHYLKQTVSEEKKQTLLIVIACALPFSAGLLFQGILPLFGATPFPGVSFLFNITCVVIAYAIYKHKLFYISHEALAENLRSALPSAMFVVDESGTILLSNPAIVQFGEKETDVVGRPVSDFLQTSPNLVKFLSEKNKTKFREESTFIRNGNPIVPIELIASDMIEDDGKKIGTILVFNDWSYVKYSIRNMEHNFSVIQEQNKSLEENKLATMKLMRELELEKKKVEEKVEKRTRELRNQSAALEAQNRIMDFFIRYLPIGAILINVETGYINIANDLAFVLFDLPPDALRRKKNYYDLVTVYKEDGSAYAKEERPLYKAINEKHMLTDQVFFHYSSGKISPLRVYVAPVPDFEGKITSAIILIEDINKEYQIDKAKTEFVSLASHQLRTPLSSINWYTEMLISGDAGKLTAQQKEFLSEIYISSRRMAELVTTLLNVSRMELGTFDVTPEELSMPEIIDKEIEFLTLQLKNKRLNLRSNYESRLPKVKVDPKIISIILQNFLTNAIKYTPEGGKIAVKVSQKKEPGDTIISVSDSGFGIPQDQQEKIFSKMFRAANIRSKSTEGNGLGLYMVKMMAEKTGCKVWFESRENKGSVFYFSIPQTGMKKTSS
ncbi:MAG: PAS domain-containing protein [Candidatus Doudnabacteria bacterium]|nr:PAS domain-containing protein [Candidatus Doudnabacteria bacterium]